MSHIGSTPGNRLGMTKVTAAQISREAELAYPNECCGVLLRRIANDTRIVERAIPCANIATDPRHRYEIAPLDVARIQRQTRDSGLDIVGFYHSHPDHDARPSATDLTNAYWPGCSYVIISVRSGAAAEINSYFLRGDYENKEFVPESIDFL